MTYPDTPRAVPRPVRDLLALLTVLVAGCARTLQPSQALLPTQLAVLAERDTPSGPQPVSLVLDLRRNSRDQLDVRVAPGLRLWDGRHLWEVTSTLDARGHGLHVGDLKAGLGGDVPLYADSALEVVGMTRRDVWVRLPNQVVFRCALDRPLCNEGPAAPLPMEHPGPGAGFRLALVNGALTLRLPFSDGEALLLDQVHALLGVHWVPESWLEHDDLLDHTYRGRGTLGAGERDVTEDGDLHDWADAEPRVVDAPWQVDTGAEAWSGPRDASFSIAAGRAGAALCFAGRVRDDAWTAEDQLVLHGIGPSDVTLSLAAPSDGPAGFVRPGWFSRAFELCLPSAASGDVAFSAAYEDHDPDGRVTVLASAPSDDGTPQGKLRIGD